MRNELIRSMLKNTGSVVESFGVGPRIKYAARYTTNEKAGTSNGTSNQSRKEFLSAGISPCEFFSSFMFPMVKVWSRRRFGNGYHDATISFPFQGLRTLHA